MTTKQSGQFHFTGSGVCHKVVGRGAPNAIRVRMGVRRRGSGYQNTCLTGDLTLETKRCTGDDQRVEHPSLANGVEVPQATAVLNSLVENSQLGSPFAFKAEGRGAGTVNAGKSNRCTTCRSQILALPPYEVVSFRSDGGPRWTAVLVECH